MKKGDISNVSSPQVICITDVVIGLREEEVKKFLSKKIERKIGDIDKLAANKLWLISNNYGISLELAGFENQGWTEVLLDMAFEKLERRIVNPFNYWQLYESPQDLVETLPYRANLKGVIDIAGRVAMYGSAGIEINNL